MLNFNFIIETIFVGVYVCFFYLFFSRFIKNFYSLLLVCGFCKHFFSSGFGLWTYYCNNGTSCLKTLSQDQQYESNTRHLISGSIIESVLFLITGVLLNYFIKNKMLLFVLIGISLHLLSEILGIHKYFCKTNCEIVNN